MTNKLGFLFIHGAGGTKSKWRQLPAYLGELPARYIDLPGHGDNHDEPCSSIEQYAERLCGQIQEDVIVVGHSMGGLIGIELAKRSNRVKGLVLVASHYQLPVHPSVLDQLSQGVFPEKLFYASYSQTIDSKLLTQELEEIDAVPISTTHRDYICCDQYSNGRQAVSEINVPILGLYGAVDRLLPKDAEEALKRENAWVLTESVEGSGHYMMIEQPKALSIILRNFYLGLSGQGVHA